MHSSKQILNSKLPKVLSIFSVTPSEMMFVMYMPIKLPYGSIRIPDNLKCYQDLIDYSIGFEEGYNHPYSLRDKYIYLTAKHMYVSSKYPGNRCGWHIDGFLSDDVNYIWTDRNPTEFCSQIFELHLDHSKSLVEMEEQVKEENIQTNPVNSLMRLDQTMVHRVSPNIEEGMRTFVKITISENRYNMAGNAHNHLLDYSWEMLPRKTCRNHTNG